MFAPPFLYAVYEAKLKTTPFSAALGMDTVDIGSCAVLSSVCPKPCVPLLYPMTSIKHLLCQCFPWSMFGNLQNSQLLACGPGLFLTLGTAGML